MQTGRIGVDTSLLIDFLNGEKHAVAFVQENNQYLVVSEIVIYEFLCGKLTKKQLNIFLAAITSFPTCVFNRDAAFFGSGMFRKAKQIGKKAQHQDCLIAGSYRAVNISKIATRNVKHFAHVDGVEVLTY